MNYSFSYSKFIVDYIRDIERELAQIDLNPSQKSLEIQLRRKNQIQTIVGSCQIEGNTLTTKLVTELLAGKKIAGSDKEILEVKNAFYLYDSIESFDPKSKKDFLKAHALLMSGLEKGAGKLRNVNVGVGSQQNIKYIAPLYKDVPELIDKMFKRIRIPEFDEITTSAIIHLEIESIHPFIDGNGRIGRFWQTLYLVKNVSPIFQYLNMEGLIKENQEMYYTALIKSQSNKNSNYFVEYMLKIILSSLKKYKESKENLSTARNRILSVKDFFKAKEFSRAEYMKATGLSSSATATRDLSEAVELNLVKSTGEKNQTKYKFL